MRIDGILPTIRKDYPPSTVRIASPVKPQAAYRAAKSERGYGLIITILMLVISSQAKRTPSRPSPLILLPPYGMWSTRKMEVSLIITPPTLIRSTARSAFRRSLV